MELHKKTIERFGDTLIHIGEASAIGGTATLFASGFPVRVSLVGIIGGALMIFVGLYIIEQSERRGV